MLGIHPYPRISLIFIKPSLTGSARQIPDLEKSLGTNGVELSKTPVELETGDWLFKVVPWIGGKMIFMTHLPSGSQWLHSRVDVNGYEEYNGVEDRSAGCSKEYIVIERNLEQGGEDTPLNLEGNIGDGLVLQRRISIRKDNSKVFQIDSGIIARSVGAGSGGFSRCSEIQRLTDGNKHFTKHLRRNPNNPTSIILHFQVERPQNYTLPPNQPRRYGPTLRCVLLGASCGANIADYVARKVNDDAPVLEYKDAVHEFATLDMLLKTPQAQACSEDIAIWVRKYISLSVAMNFLIEKIKPKPKPKPKLEPKPTVATFFVHFTLEDDKEY